MPIVSATVVQPQTYVRLQTSWADMSSVDYVRFVRVNPVTCEEVVVRVHTAYDPTGQYILLSCDDSAVVWDTEAPLGVNLQYRVDGLGTTTTVTSAVVNIDDNDELHLKDPLRPCHDVRIGLCIDDPSCVDSNPGTFYIGHAAEEYPPHHVNLLPVNASKPITRSRLRQDAITTLVVGTQLCADMDAMKTLTAPGTPLLFQALPEYCIPDRYTSVETHTIGKLGVDQRLPVRSHDLPYVTVERPPGPGQGPCGVRWNDMCDTYATWNAMQTAGLSWNDLLLGFASPDTDVARRRWIDVETGFANWLAVENHGNWQVLRDGL